MQRTKMTRVHRMHPSEPGSAGLAAGFRPEIAANDLAVIGVIVSQETTADLSHYRAELVRDAVARRMALQRFERSAEYVQYLREYSSEARNLLRELRASPDGFFREPQIFHALRTAFVTGLQKEGQAGAKLRAWVPGCGNGAAAYSVAIALIEMLEQAGPRCEVQVFGTDFDERALDVARAGVFPDALLSRLADAQRARFFGRAGDGYRIQREVRDLCVFARHSLASDPPLGRMDLVVFQNQLQPLNETMRHQVLERLQYSLKPNGVLAIGQSQLPEAAIPGFTPISESQGVFLRRADRRLVWVGSCVSPKPLNDHLDTAAPTDGRAPSPDEIPRLPHLMGVVDEREARRHFYALLEEQARALESLRVANQEIISSNEELQVSNEELMAAREGLEAANQELAALYDEMQHRNQALSHLSSELMALFRSMDLAVVTVGSALEVRRFTPKAARLFGLTAADEGRPITDLQPKLVIPELGAILQAAIENLTSHECPARMANGAAYRVSIRPCRSEDNRIDGAIVTAWPAVENGK